MAIPDLLGIPPELRNKICTYALQDTQAEIGAGKKYCPGIVMACRQLYEETLKVYYHTVSFLISPQNLTRAAEHLSTMPEECRNAIAHLEIDDFEVETYDAARRMVGSAFDYTADDETLESAAKDIANEARAELSDSLRELGISLPEDSVEICERWIQKDIARAIRYVLEDKWMEREDQEYEESLYIGPDLEGRSQTSSEERDLHS